MSPVIRAAQNRFDLGWPDQALALLQQAQDDAQTGAERIALAVEQAKIYLAQQHADEAVQALSQAEDRSAQLAYLLGLAYRQLGRWRQAVASFEQADQLAADDPAILANLGWSVYRQGRKNRGRQMLERALRLDLGRLPTSFDLALLYADLGRWPAALACAKRAYAISGGSPQAHKIIVRITEMMHSHVGASRRRSEPPGTERQWRQLIGEADKPLDLMQLAIDRFNPQSERELNQLADRMTTWWNSTPRPELGGLSPDQVSQQVVRPSQVELPPPPIWVFIDPAVAEANILRRNMVHYLIQLREVKYTATSGRGNLPLKALYAINAQLVEPLDLEDQIGDKIYKPRSSEHVWLFDFLRALTLTGELASFEPGRRIRIKAAGHQYLESAPRRQLGMLFSVWWRRTNWLYVYPWQTFRDEAMHVLPRLTRDMLLALTPRQWAQVGEFIGALMAAGSLHEFSETTNLALLQRGLEKMVLYVPAQFDCVEMQYQPEKIGAMQFDTPVQFRVTPLGHELLESV